MGVCGTSLWAWKDCVITSASLLPQPLSYSLSFIDKSRWRIFTLSQILLYLKKIFAFCSPRDFFSLPTTSLSVSVKSNFSFKFKPELCPEISSSYSGVIFCISCYFAFRETESYLAEFYCSYQGHTAPIIKRAELLPCRTQIWLRKVNIILKRKPDLLGCQGSLNRWHLWVFYVEEVARDPVDALVTILLICKSLCQPQTIIYR